MKFIIPLVADARVSARVEVDADTLEEAQTIALRRAKQSLVNFDYDGIDEDTIELADE
jgi:hypothetical protein